MRKYSRKVYVLVILIIGLISGCSSGPGSTPASTVPVVVFSDLHFNPFYDTSLFAALNAADASDWPGIFQTSHIVAPSIWGSDTNYPLLEITLSSIHQNLGSSPLIIFTGDILGHGIPQLYYMMINGTTNPRDDADTAAMKAFTLKTVNFVMSQIRASIGNIPVLFVLGNGDSYEGNGPDSTYLADTASLYYTKFLNSTIDQTAFLATFTVGGYYAAELPGTNMMVIGLNTYLCSPLLAGDNDSAVAIEFDWLQATLASAQAAGKKVWLLMHVPTGADLATTASNADANGQLSSATMMWKPAYQTSFQQILANYEGLITLSFAGHTHMDEYRIMYPGDVLELTPSISPCFGNNPGFKVYTLASDTLTPTDYTSFNYDLATMPEQFNSYYTFSVAYGLQGLLEDSQAALFPALATDLGQQSHFRDHYFSGHNYTIPMTNTVNPITDTTWPIYWSGIGIMDQGELINSVNHY